MSDDAYHVRFQHSEEVLRISPRGAKFSAALTIVEYDKAQKELRRTDYQPGTVHAFHPDACYLSTELPVATPEQSL